MMKKISSAPKILYQRSVEYAGELVAVINTSSESFQKYPVIVESLGKFSFFASDVGLTVANAAGFVVSGSSLIAMYQLYEESVGKVTDKILASSQGKVKNDDTTEPKSSLLKRIFSVFGQVFGTLGSLSNGVLSAYNGWLMGAIFHLPIDVLIIIMGLLGICGFFGTFALGRPPAVACFEDTADLLTEGSPNFSLEHKKRLGWTLCVIAISIIGTIAAGLFVAMATKTIIVHMIVPHLMLPSALIITVMAILGTSTGVVTAALMGRALHREGMNLGLVIKGKKTLGFSELTISQKIRSALAGFLALALAVGGAFGGFFGTQTLFLNTFHLAAGIVFPLAGTMAIAFGIMTLGLVARPLQLELVHKTINWDGYTRDQKILSVLLNIAGAIQRITPAAVIFVLPIIGIPVTWPLLVAAFVGSFALMLFIRYIENKCLQVHQKNKLPDATPAKSSIETDGHDNDDTPTNDIEEVAVKQLGTTPEAEAIGTSYRQVDQLIRPVGETEYVPIRSSPIDYTSPATRHISFMKAPPTPATLKEQYPLRNSPGGLT